MKKKKQQQVFFEVFRRPHESKPTPWRMRTSAEAAGEKEGAGQSLDRLAGRSNLAATDGRVAISLSREVLAILMFAVVVLVIASHVWGYSRGRRQQILAQDQAVGGASGESATGSAGNSSRPLQLNVSTPSMLEPPFYAVRVISGISRSSARRLAAELTQRGHDAFIYDEPNQNGFTVNVGRFRSSQELRRSGLLSQLAATYTGCYPVRISDKRRIAQ